MRVGAKIYCMEATGWSLSGRSGSLVWVPYLNVHLKDIVRIDIPGYGLWYVDKNHIREEREQSESMPYIYITDGA